MQFVIKLLSQNSIGLTSNRRPGGGIMRLSCKTFFISLLLSSISICAFAREHQIFTVAEDLPMGFANEVLRRNYYVDIGSDQGVSKGTTLDVFRTISKSNPYDNQKRVNYRVKIGELEILHSEQTSSIGILKTFEGGIKSPLFDISGFMIGDMVTVKVK